MKNKSLCLFFLLLPAAMQCMEQEITIKPKSLQSIKNDRDTVYNKRFSSQQTIDWPLDLLLFQENWSDTLNFIEIGNLIGLDTVGIDVLKQQVTNKNPKDTFNIIQNPHFYTHHFNKYGYSSLGIAAIAIKQVKILNDDNYTLRGNRKKLFQNKQDQERALFSEKKACIEKLMSYGITPTPKDKEFALLATYEENQLSAPVIKKYLLLKHCPILVHMNIPQELIHDIAVRILAIDSPL